MPLIPPVSGPCCILVPTGDVFVTSKLVHARQYYTGKGWIKTTSYKHTYSQYYTSTAKEPKYKRHKLTSYQFLSAVSGYIACCTIAMSTITAALPASKAPPDLVGASVFSDLVGASVFSDLVGASVFSDLVGASIFSDCNKLLDYYNKLLYSQIQRNVYHNHFWTPYLNEGELNVSKTAAVSLYTVPLHLWSHSV